MWAISKVCVLALPNAGQAFQASGIKTEILQIDSLSKVLSNRLRTIQPYVIVTGTSHYEKFESILWSLGKKTKVVSCAIIDGWYNLAQRFTNGRPDKIFAIDEDQKAQLIKNKILSGNIECVGQLYLQDLIKNHAPTSLPNSLIKQILFISEPIKEDVESQVNVSYGFDQFKAFRLLKKAAQAFASSINPIQINIKLHPYENLKNWEKKELLSNNKNLIIKICKESTNCIHYIEKSNLVAGISSVVLLQAICIGRPVISLQPNLARENTLIAAARGFVETILSDDKAAIKRIGDLIFEDFERMVTLRRNKEFFETHPSGGVDSVVRWIKKIRK